MSLKTGIPGWVWMQALITGYNTLKLASLDGILPKTGKCNVTPFSKLDVAWSFRGSADGLDDNMKGGKVCYDLTAPEPPV